MADIALAVYCRCCAEAVSPDEARAYCPTCDDVRDGDNARALLLLHRLVTLRTTEAWREAECFLREFGAFRNCDCPGCRAAAW